MTTTPAVCFHTNNHATLCSECAVVVLRAKLNDEVLPECCWNMRNVPSEGHNDDCNSFGPKFGEATLVVTFIGGDVLEYPGARFALNTVASDPIKVDGTTVRFETMEQQITLCGVRSFKMEHYL